MKFQPTYNKVVVKPDPSEKMTKGGLIIPAMMQEKNQKGTIIAVGPGRYENGKLIEPCVKVNDRVIFTKYVGVLLKINNEDIIVMPDQEIIMVIDETDEKVETLEVHNAYPQGNSVV